MSESTPSPIDQPGVRIKSTPRSEEELQEFLARMDSWGDVLTAPDGLED